jgi:hypothetical protein
MTSWDRQIDKAHIIFNEAHPRCKAAIVEAGWAGPWVIHSLIKKLYVFSSSVNHANFSKARVDQKN